jgi:MFS family permease
MVIVAAPSLIVEVTQDRNIRLALAGWAAYVPAGVALVTLLAPFVLAHHSWRAVWIIDAVVLAVYALLIIVRPAPKQESRGRSAIVRPWQDFKAVFTARGPVLLAIIFAMYTFQHLGIMGLMPTVLIENYRVSPNSAGVLVSSAMAANILGNLAAGVLLQRGVRRSVLIGSTSIFMALMTIGMFSAHLPLAPAYVCCFLFSCVGGIVPGSVISAAPFYSPSESLIPATNGLLVQGSNLGIVLGPPLISSIAAHAGWAWVPALTLIAAIVATILALIVNRSVQHALDKALQGS